KGLPPADAVIVAPCTFNTINKWACGISDTFARVRTTYRMPGEPKGLPPADAVIVAPCTFNTINKWACGISDTFAVGLLCEVMGFDVPILAAPQLKAALARHLAFARNIALLEEMGVRVLFDPDAPPESRMPSWERIMQELHTLIAERRTRE
ncbi:flavoprotein, partial [Nonomuraea typhae]